MKSLLDKMIETKGLNGELILHSQDKMRKYNKVISMIVTPLENPVKLRICRNINVIGY